MAHALVVGSAASILSHPFMRHALVFNVISALTFVAAVFFLFHNHLKFSVEFTGGTVMEVKYAQAANLEQVRTTRGGLGYHAEVSSIVVIAASQFWFTCCDRYQASTG